MKLVEDLLVSHPTISYSPAVSMGDANCAMYEVWVTALSGGNLTVTLEGSNDGLNWTAITNPTAAAAIAAAPAYQANQPDHGTSSGTVILSWSMLRLKFVQSASSSLVSASIRPFRSA